MSFIKDLLGIAILLVALSFVVFVLKGCQTSRSAKPLPDCDAHLEAEAKQLESQGFMFAGADARIDKTGVLLLAAFVNPEVAKVQLIAITDTQLSLNEGLSHGYVRAGSCQRGGRRWFVLKKTEQAKLPEQVKSPSALPL